MVDCAGGDFGNSGCEGGLTSFAYLYTDEQPLELEEDYPYMDKQGLTCNFK